MRQANVYPQCKPLPTQAPSASSSRGLHCQSVNLVSHQVFLGPGKPDSLDLTLILSGLRVSKLNISPLIKN